MIKSILIHFETDQPHRSFMRTTTDSLGVRISRTQRVADQCTAASGRIEDRPGFVINDFDLGSSTNITIATEQYESKSKFGRRPPLIESPYRGRPKDGWYNQAFIDDQS